MSRKRNELIKKQSHSNMDVLSYPDFYKSKFILIKNVQRGN